jgi:Tfp pilus assembly protein FimV
MPKASSAKLAEPKADNIEEIEVERTKILEVISPSAEMTVPKAQKDLTATPKRKRMVNVLDVLETIKTSSSTPEKTTEASKTQTETKLTEAEAAKSQAETEAGPSEPDKEKSLEIGEKETEKEAAKQILPKKMSLLLLKHLPKYLIILYDTLREKDYLKKRFLKLNTMPEN